MKNYPKIQTIGPITHKSGDDLDIFRRDFDDGFSDRAWITMMNKCYNLGWPVPGGKKPARKKYDRWYPKEKKRFGN